MADDSSRYERKDFSPKAVGLSGLGLIVVCVISAVLIRHFEKDLNQFFAYQGRATWTSSPTMQPPEPRLQTNSAREFAEMRAQEEAELHSYGWVDRQYGVIHIPIDAAIKIALERGLPVRKSTPTAAATPVPAPATPTPAPKSAQ
ncbi:hypothetical protein CfE428DRAFT_5771 [Chthoniobacter flavus Ellin428]|uniref:Uncharacterized protein n=1 Tax=Chthoniobacter flavus Ellin428 TaxID=497964 RepID=B4DA31_9BACT|nr:hypothetical protein [Chthoniobacter flavus]EDY16658.1 hypothetical protein CfE428DRAFT_5771 [Chthoniobacter flavus Ellin428]TCO87232.1 hypothetical protein EV701_12369 [Chthoniobacter flavus]